jgi:hypothetical protein
MPVKASVSRCSPGGIGCGNVSRARSAASSRRALPSTTWPSAVCTLTDRITSSAALSRISLTGSETVIATVSWPAKVAASRSGSRRMS